MAHFSLTARVLATNTALLHHGEGLALSALTLSAAFFLITRRGFAGARRTGPANYAGGGYLGLLVLRWILLAAGLVGVGLIIAAVV
jgi:hypothetical protein